MDKSKMIIEALRETPRAKALNLDDIIAGTHTRIRKRARRRKIAYASPVVGLLLLMVLVTFPGSGEDELFTGGELFMAGWQTSWTMSDETIDQSNSLELYDKSVDYLFNEHFYTYADEASELLDETDLEAFIGYMKETS